MFVEVFDKWQGYFEELVLSFFCALFTKVQDNREFNQVWKKSLFDIEFIFVIQIVKYGPDFV
jgi:hypothetical protein